MEILVKGLASPYEIEHLARVFYPGAPLRAGGGTRGPLVYARCGRSLLVAGVRNSGTPVVATAPLQRGPGALPAKRQLSRLLYSVLQNVTGVRPPWGMLTGVRPVRLVRNLLAKGEREAQREMQSFYGVSDKKYALAQEIARRQHPFLAGIAPRSYSLYVSIPFCPTRCSYCSFVSRTIGREAALVAPYLEKLKAELAATAQIAAQLGLTLRSVYIGGGTPTAVSAAQLEGLMAHIAAHFDIRNALEYTVEAGRPDCTDAEKLRAINAHGATRISINPQTLRDDVLRRIGRRHTAADIIRCYREARVTGHENINMDLIAGLPGDDVAGFVQSLTGVVALAPQNITLHTLTLKRASNLVVEGATKTSPPAQMVEAAYPLLRGAGYRPYYLYRQKGTVQNLENTGWAKPGFEGMYNIDIMEEMVTILAVGAGASTKLVAAGTGPGQLQIQRSYNPKFPVDYIAGFGQVLRKKEEVKEFYACYLDTQTPG